MMADVSREFAEKSTELALLASQLGLKVAQFEFEVASIDEVDFGTSGEHLKRYINSPVKSDVHLLIDGVSYFGHKQTLAASSKYFEAMFSDESGFKESKEFTVKIELPVILSLELMLLILEYAYTGSKARITQNLTASATSKKSDLLNILMVVEYLQMETLLTELEREVYILGPSFFKSQVGWKENTVLSEDFIKSTLEMCVTKGATLRIMLEWLNLATSSPERPHGWDLTTKRSQALSQLVQEYVCTRTSALPWIQLPPIFRDLNYSLLTHLPMSAVLPSIQTYTGIVSRVCQRNQYCSYRTPQTTATCASCGHAL